MEAPVRAMGGEILWCVPGLAFGLGAGRHGGDKLVWTCRCVRQVSTERAGGGAHGTLRGHTDGIVQLHAGGDDHIVFPRWW